MIDPNNMVDCRANTITIDGHTERIRPWHPIHALALQGKLPRDKAMRMEIVSNYNPSDEARHFSEYCQAELGRAQSENMQTTTGADP